MLKIQNILEIENHLDGIKAVIFDLDDTLYNEIDYIKSGFSKISKAFPQVKDMRDKLWRAYQSGKKPINQVLADEKLDSDENIARCLAVYRFHKPNIVLDVQIQELLHRIKVQGIKLGIITDGRIEGQRAKIDALELKEIFDEIIITDELGGPEFRKPNEKAFVLMCEKLNVLYTEAVYVGDNVRKDFIAPEKLGMQSIWFVNPKGIYNK